MSLNSVPLQRESETLMRCFPDVPANLTRQRDTVRVLGSLADESYINCNHSRACTPLIQQVPVVDSRCPGSLSLSCLHITTTAENSFAMHAPTKCRVSSPAASDGTSFSPPGQRPPLATRDNVPAVHMHIVDYHRGTSWLASNAISLIPLCIFRAG